MIINDSSSQKPGNNEPEVNLSPSDNSEPNTSDPATLKSVEDANAAKTEAATHNKFSLFSSIQTIVTYAFLLATLFTLFTPDNLFSGQMLTRVFEAWQANPTFVAPVSTAIPGENINRIGIVSGHWKNDSGSVCQNGLTEEQVNLTIASLVQQKLTDEGFQVDLMQDLTPAFRNIKPLHWSPFTTIPAIISTIWQQDSRWPQHWIAPTLKKPPV